MLGLMMTALNLTNCTKDTADNGLGTSENVITHTIVVDNEPWGGDARSIYEPGVGIHRDGTETISVYYSVATGDDTYKFPTVPVMGTPAGDGTYTFTHTIAEGATTYDYYFMMPHLATSRSNSKGDASYHRIGPVQLPKADTFDPSYDYLVGKPVKNVHASVQTTVVTQFKRLTTPLRLRLSDGAGILAGQKIQQVTIAFDDTTNKGTNKCLSGLFYFKYSEDVDQNKMSGWEAGSMSNTATADYPTGLEQDGSWETWLMVNPTTLNPASMTITVVSDKMRITRTIPTAGKTFDFQKDAINSIGIDVTGAGYKAEDAYSIGFTQYSKMQSVFTATDGVDHEWSFTGCSYTKQDYIGNALRLKTAAQSGAITLPAVSDSSYKTIYITENANNSSKAAPGSILCGGTEVTTADFSYYGPIAQQGGVLAIDIPAEYAQGPLTIQHSCSEQLSINRITVVYGEPQETPGPGPEPEPEDDDYYTTYSKGGDITIGNLIVNKTNFPEAKLVNIASFKNTNFTEGGLVFIDGEGSYTMTASPSIHKGLILIGNNPKKQPTIVCQGSSSVCYFAIRGEDCDYAFKNLNIDGSNNNYVFANSDNANASGKVKSVTIEDCTIVTNGNVIQDSNSTNSMQDITVRNCVIRMPAENGGKAVYGWATGKTNKATDQLATVTLTNNVIYALSPINQYLVMVGGKATNTAYDSNATIVVEHNSTYNIYHGNGLVSAYSAADIQVNYNVSALLDGSHNSYNVGYSKPNDPKNFTITNNFAFTNSETTQRWKAIWKNTDVTATSTTKNNSFTLQEIPFLSTNLETGYFPIDATVVTNNAGASYETKLWNEWE